MATGSFTAYAPPNIFGPWVTAIDGLGYDAAVRIDVEPQGSTTIFGEVQFANETGQQTVMPFQGIALFKTCNCLQDIKVRLKGVPLGSAVDGSWQTQSLRSGTVFKRVPKGVSLHIGLNHVDPNHYAGWSGSLSGCENDAQDMEQIAMSTGFNTTKLLTREATASAVLKILSEAADALVAGDIFLLSYSGHGGQIPDVNGDEDDGLDETWVLFDRMLVDDELYAMFGKFHTGVRLVMVSDSCHSGTSAKDAFYNAVAASGALSDWFREKAAIRPKVVPEDVLRKVYRASQHTYNAIQWSNLKGDNTQISASVILLAACQDNQTASDGIRNGLFTDHLKQVWRDGSFRGNYYDFCRQISLTMPATQTPNYYTVGSPNPGFESEGPFLISADSRTPTRPRRGLSKTAAVRALNSIKREMEHAFSEIERKVAGKRCV